MITSLVASTIKYVINNVVDISIFYTILNYFSRVFFFLAKSSYWGCSLLAIIGPKGLVSDLVLFFSGSLGFRLNMRGLKCGARDPVFLVKRI